MTNKGLAVGDKVVVEIERAAGDGVCVARHEGQVLFVRDVLPGEQARVRVTSLGRKGRFVRAELSELLRASEHRVVPPCNLARECGGCDWQHADLAYQRELKRDILLENLRKFGDVVVDSSHALEGLRVEALPDAPGLEPGLGYRTRMRFAINDAGLVGLKAARSHKIIPAADCLLPVLEISEAIPESVTNFGDERALVAVASAVVASDSDMGHDEGADDELHPAQYDPAASEAETRQSAANDAPVLQAEFGGADTHRPVAATVRERVFEVDINGFWQVHRAAPETLVNAVLEFADVQSGETVLDLYCGVGLFSAFLAEATGPTGAVHAIEGSPDAIEYAKQNLDDLPWATMTCEDVRELAHLTGDEPGFAGHPQHFVHPAAPSHVTAPLTEVGLIVTDPPRAGLGAEVVEAIVAQQPSRVVYVSCDSATFARDIKTFAELGYELDQLRAFDLFPMTKHLETVALLAPAAS